MRRFAGRPIVVLTAALVVTACGGPSMASGPLGPCTADRADAMSIGGFPELEALVPRSLDGVAPDVVNSGRSCSDRALGSLAARGIRELRYAGSTWNQGKSDATVVAVLATPPDQPPAEQAWIEEFYTAGAVAATKTDNVTTTRPTMDPAGQVFRIDALNDLSLQTVVTWNEAGLVHVVIVATEVGPTASRTEHDARVAAAVAIAKVQGPTPFPASPAGPSGAP